jgi:hypothetical protein
MAPARSIASLAYSEQLGWNLQAPPRTFDSVAW